VRYVGTEIRKLGALLSNLGERASNIKQSERSKKSLEIHNYFDDFKSDMKDTSQIQKILKENIPKLQKEYEINQLGMFGSYVRNEQTSESDLDLLVTFKKKPSLFRFIELENYLSDLLDTKVDLVMESALKPRIGETIRREVVIL